MNRFCTYYRVLATSNWNHSLITPFIDWSYCNQNIVLNVHFESHPEKKRLGFQTFLRALVCTSDPNTDIGCNIFDDVLTLHQPFPISSGSKSNIFPPFCVSTAKSNIHLFEVKIEVIVIQHHTQVELGHYTLAIINLQEHSLQHTSGVNSTVNFKPFQLNVKAVKNQNTKTQPLTSFVFWETSIAFSDSVYL